MHIESYEGVYDCVSIWCCVSLFCCEACEVMCDLSVLNEKFEWFTEMPTIFAFAAVSAVCRTALDLRCVINDAYFRKSKKEKFETPPSANVPAVACIKVSILQVVMASILHLWKEKNSEVHIIKILRGINRVKNCHWATCRGLKAGMEALMKEGLANSDGLIAVGELAD